MHLMRCIYPVDIYIGTNIGNLFAHLSVMDCAPEVTWEQSRREFYKKNSNVLFFFIIALSKSVYFEKVYTFKKCIIGEKVNL